MKYLFLLTILLGCNSKQGKTIVTQTNKDTTAEVSVKHDSTSINTDDPYQTGKDTIQLNKVMNKIFQFPEVKALNKQIYKDTKGGHGVTIIVEDEFDGDTSYYDFSVGDNSNKYFYMNFYDFLLEKKTGQIKAYDDVSGSIMTLKEWRKKGN